MLTGAVAPAKSGAVGEFPAGRRLVHGYVLRWTASPHWQLQLSVDNLWDEHYETAVGFGAPGRALRIGVRLTH